MRPARSTLAAPCRWIMRRATGRRGEGATDEVQGVEAGDARARAVAVHGPGELRAPRTPPPRPRVGALLLDPEADESRDPGRHARRAGPRGPPSGAAAR